jgi:hypothetical protein
MYVLGFLLLLTGKMLAQQAPEEEGGAIEQTLQEWYEKDQAFDFFVHLHNSANVYFQQHSYSETHFKTDQLRLELKGEMGQGIFYTVNHRLNSSTRAAGMDNLSRATDVAMVRFAVSPHLFVTAGKQCLAFGGYEFDQYPIDVYAYSDLVYHMESFLTGIEVGAKWERQIFKFQVVNSRTDYATEIYENLPAGVEKSKNPLGATIAWNGSIADGKVQTRWSYSVFEEAKKNYMHYWAFGTQWQLAHRIQIQTDVMFSNEDLDRKGLATALINPPDVFNQVATDVTYHSYVVKTNMLLTDKLNFFVKGMHEQLFMPGEDRFASRKVRTSIGYLGGLEYFPATGLKLFAVYVGRDYSFAHELNGRPDTQVTHTDQITLGLIYLLQMF